MVSRNAGDKLYKTLQSILSQTYENYEVVWKDGCSSDGSVDRALDDSYTQKNTQKNTQKSGEEPVSLRHDPRIRLTVKPDQGIYDAMNQAVEEARGSFLIFLNCGDTFAGPQVLEKTAHAMAAARQNGHRSRIFYGNTYAERLKTLISSAPQMDGFACYRNIPCHQSCFYDRHLFDNKKYDTSLKIRADYDHFLWCFYEGKAEPLYMDFTVASYEGGGVSESRENRNLDREEWQRCIHRYMKKSEIRHYRLLMALSLAPLRRWIAETPALSGGYHRIKSLIYGRKNTESADK